MQDFVDLLKTKFNQKRAANLRYTLKSFSELFDESPSYMHRVMSRKIKMTPTKIYKCCKKLDLDDQKTCEYLLFHLSQEHQLDAGSNGTEMI